MTPNTGKDVEQQVFSFIAGGNAKWYTLEDSLVVSYKTKHTLTIQVSGPWYLLKGVESLSTQNPTH